MNVQLILIQAGIELAREVLASPITRGVLVDALCKISDGSLCQHRFGHETGWKAAGGEMPTVMIHARDADDDELTLTCGVDFLHRVSRIFKTYVLGLDTFSIVSSYFESLVPDIELTTHLETKLSSAPNSMLDLPLTSLDEFESFVYNEVFGSNQKE